MDKLRIPILEGTGSETERHRLVESLQAALQRMEGDRGPRWEGVVSSGCGALDALLPEGGWRRGTLVEWLSGAAGSGAGALALMVARQAAVPMPEDPAAGGVVVVVDRQRRFYPPAAAALGIDLQRLLVVRPNGSADEIWALDQVLRCPGVAAVWAPIERLDEQAFRRLQLAAESSGCLGLLLRPLRVRGQPSWSHLQLLVEPCGDGPPPSPSPALRLPETLDRPVAITERVPSGLRRVRVERIRCRRVAVAGRDGGPPGVELAIDEINGGIYSASSDHETPSLHLAASLAHPAAFRRSARA
jgi:protein ImuA